MDAKIREKRTNLKNDYNTVELRHCTLHFNLRQPKSNNPTQLYAIINIRYRNGANRQYKVSLGEKILPSNWDKRRERIKINGTENIETIERLNKILALICNLDLVFKNLFCIFATDEYFDVGIVETIKDKIIKFKSNNTMNVENLKKNRGVTASKVLNKAFEDMYIGTGRTDSTISMQRRKLDKYLTFLCNSGVTDSAQNRFTIEGINAYRKYLHENFRMSKKHSYKLIEFVVSLINHAVANRTKDLGFQQISIKGFSKSTIRRNTKDDNKHVEIHEYEIEKLKSLSQLSKRLADTRDLFIFGCTIGCRYNDLYKILCKQYEIRDVDGEKQLVYNTQNRNSKHVTAYVPFSISDVIARTLQKIENEEYGDIGKTSAYFNKKLKELFEVAKLNRIITYKDANGDTHREPLSKVVSSHDCRVTAATHLLRKYGDVEFVVKVCGWVDSKMIKEVYSRLSIEDEARNQSKRMKKVSNKEVQSTQKDELTELRDVLVYLGADYADVYDITSPIDLFVEVKKYEEVLISKGANYYQIKEIYNEKTPFKERINKLKALVS